uniref:Argonaute 2 n=1 Tax=Laodelphax striatellus TaxID=195883 RepID=A0A0N7A4X9_LAOST|nr:Argonaute 2 [Laodelphax striatellus]
MSKMAVSQWKIPERKKNGTRGRKIELELNHFELFFKKQNFIAIHYDVTFKPDKPRRMFRPIMEAFRQKKYPNNYPAFDGRKNLYSARELPFGMEVTDTVKVFNSERQMHQEYEVTVKFASRVDMSQLSQYLSGKGHSYQTPQEALQAVDIVLRNPAALTFVGVGRSFFSEPEQIIDLGEGLELWYGFYQSAILGWKPFLNVDVAHKGFPMGERLLETLCRYQKCSFNDLRNLKRLDSYVQNDFEKYIKGLKVEYQIPNRTDTKRTYKVNKLMKNSVEQRFTLEKDNKKVEMTVGEYFQREKKCSLQFPYLPLVWIGPQNKEFYVPMEMCTIVRGQAVNRKLTPIQTAEMVKNAAKPPDERRKRIANALRRANFNNDKCVQEFGITVSDRFAQVTGRVLEPPNLEYNKQMIKPSKGVWRSGKFLQAVQINNWAIINCDRRTNEGSLQRFASEMITHGRTLGVMIGSQPKIIPFAHIQPNRPNWRKDFGNQLSSLRENKTEIVVVVIPDQGEIYPMVKQTAELSVGILTQCIKSKTMYKMNPATVGNILLKVNSKLNGLNHRLGGRPKLLARPAMIMGADVTHPSPDQTNIPSVAAVSASHDANGFMYNMMWRLQPAKMEIIEDLQNIVVAQLKYFFAKTRQKPETIYFFRDGVSEGMFNQVLSAELTAIRQACRSLNENYKPGITFLVVQKRHHTRFFPMHDRDKEGRLGNVPAGTIVDTQITHKTETDFYLVSHASIQGTARPTKYHLLWDDNNIDEDDLEELTYNLCHLFTRCTRSVSYPAPTYYAHLAAFRARVYLEGQQTTPNLKREMETRVIEVNFHKENPMFFV